VSARPRPATPTRRRDGVPFELSRTCLRFSLPDEDLPVDDVSTRAPSRVLADRYALLERLGAGGAGVVWRAHDQLLERTVAVKVLHRDLADDPGTTERFRAEAAAAAKLTHPHAVIVYDIGETDEGDYLVMELVEGATLSQLLDQGPLPAGVVAALGDQVGRALGAAHGRGLVHRDVKPANILVTNEGVAKVADFGIARALGDATSRLTVTGHVMGTARYLAPEQLRDEAIDARADVYALGLVLHQCLTGQQPFGEGTAIEIASRRLVGDLPAPSQVRDGVPPALDEAICRAVQLDPDGRFADGAEFAAALGDLSAPYAAQELSDRIRRLPPPPNAIPVGEDGGAGEARDGGPATPAPTAPRREPTPVQGTEVPGAQADPAEAQTTRALGAIAPQRTSPGTVATGAAAAQTTVRAGTATDRTRPAGADGSAGSSEPAGPTDAAPDGRRRGWGPWGGVIVLALVALIAVLALGRSAVDEDPDTAAQDESAEGAEGDQPEVFAVTGGSDHDPFGSGEHGDRVAEAYDGDPGTYWRTQQYRGSPALGGLKPGVGIWLDLGEPRAVGELVVTTTNPGADFTVFVGDGPPAGGEAPEDWGTAVAEVTDAADEQRIELDEVTEGQVWMLWFTSLPPDGGRYRATVSDVRFLPG
jgi:eukaryotic-like serine/threonine-protein kinase